MDMTKIAKIAGSRLLSAVKIVTGALLLAMIPALMIYYNYTVDSSSFFQGELEIRAIADMLLEGNDITGYDMLTSSQRKILSVIVNNIDPMPDTVALGSSRILQLNTETSGAESFFNFAVTGGDVADILGTFYQMEREDRLPNTIIIGFDPWLLREGEFGMDTRSDKVLYAEFVNSVLDLPMAYQKADSSEKWQALISPVYFQENITFAGRKNAISGPQLVVGDVYNQTSEVKRSDGSLVYTVDFRNRTVEEVREDALTQSDYLLRMTDYPAVDQSMVEIFDAFFAHAKQCGVNIVLVLTPYHPLTYDVVMKSSEKWGGFIETEPTVRALAAKYEIPVYGSYNPHAIADVDEHDFYDGLHCSGECLAKLFTNATTPPETSGANIGQVLDAAGNVIGGDLSVYDIETGAEGDMQ